MRLHVPTIAAMAALVGAELALGFLAVGWTLGRQRGLGLWVAGAVSLAAGGLFWGLRAVLPELAIVLVANGLQYVGFALLWAGSRDFCSRRRSPLLPALGLPAFLAGLHYFAVEVPSTRARVVVFGLGIAPLSLAIAWTFFRHAPSQLRRSARIAGIAFGFHGLCMLVRCFLPQEGTSTVDLLRPGWAQTLTALEIFAAAIGTMLVLVALLAHRLMVDLAAAARVDGLTGVLNRRALEEEAREALAVCARLQIPCAALLFDLDHFKRINDTHGHQAGDAALRHFADLVRPTLRRSDVFGRYGGEEFLAIMPGAGPEEARGAAERLRSLVEAQPLRVAGADVPLRVSIGLAWGERAALEPLVARADAALYRAKEAGRNRVAEAAV